MDGLAEQRQVVAGWEVIDALRLDSAGAPVIIAGLDDAGLWEAAKAKVGGADGRRGVRARSVALELPVAQLHGWRHSSGSNVVTDAQRAKCADDSAAEAFEAIAADGHARATLRGATRRRDGAHIGRLIEPIVQRLTSTECAAAIDAHIDCDVGRVVNSTRRETADTLGIVVIFRAHQRAVKAAAPR